MEFAAERQCWLAVAVNAQPEQFMRMALQVAQQGIALASPNPHVGAVIVDAEGNVAGRGYYTYEGRKHAEVLALEEAGARARGGTLYINLEPCCHFGRTGPCVETVIAAGVRHAYAAMADPNPLVSGKGFERLRSAGVEVHTGLLEGEARELNAAFAKFIRSRTPLVTVKAGMTLDGKIAPPSGASENPSALGAATASRGWITGELARAHVQKLRHAVDAIAVGVGTIVVDDPLLTDRTGLPRRRSLLRVVLDSRLRIPIESRVVQTAEHSKDVLVFCSVVDQKRKAALEGHGVTVERVASADADGRPDLRQVLRRLGELDITSVLVEGGALVNGALLAAGLVDKIFLYYAPKILAGSHAVPFASGPGFPRISEAAYVRHLKLHRFGEDFAVEGYLKDPYRE